MDEHGKPAEERRGFPPATFRHGPSTGGRRMDSGSRYLILASVIAVFVVLLAGLWNMLRGTSPNLSQTLLRWRVGLQFLAIVIKMLLVYLSGRS
jgi:hypothetical protein